MNLNLPSTNQDEAVGGRWIEYPDAKGVRFKVAMSNNIKHKRAIQHKLKSIEKLRDKGDYARVEILNAEIIAKHILKDWEGVFDEGKPWPFTEANALLLLRSEDYSTIKDFIVDESLESSEYETEASDIAKK